MSILNKINGIDLALLKEQSHLLEAVIEAFEEDAAEAVTDEVAERAEHDADLARGLLELVDVLVIHLEEL